MSAPRNERFVQNSSTSCLPIFATLIMPYRALYRLLEKPSPIVPEAAFYFYPRRARLSVSFQITILKVLGSRLIRSTKQEPRRGRQRPGSFVRAGRSG